MGKVDQGVFSFWMLSHHFGRPLTYIGFDGSGKQVRDLLHVDDLVDLIDEQLGSPDRWTGTVFNVGGGRACSLSLLELTDLCRDISGRRVAITSEPEARPGDVPIFVSDCSALFAYTDWRPQKGARSILVDISSWVTENESALRVSLD
jgi:CDP-paratose 2-epimerase